jgi:peptide/nickel transport system permease protein
MPNGAARVDRIETGPRSSSLALGVSDSLAVYVARRALTAVLVAVALSALTFLMLRLLTPESFPDPRALHVELVDYLADVFLRADFGNSLQQPFLPVRTMLLDALPADLSLLIGAVIIGPALGIAGGMVCVRRPRSLAARALGALAAIFLCAPVYFVGFLTILLFAPSVGAPIPIFLVTTNTYAGLTDDPVTWLRSLVVPWIVAGLPLAAMCLRMIRGTLPEVLNEDFVRTATAKGLTPRRIAFRHTLPVALPATISLVGAYMPVLLANVILVEAVFGIPGIYRLIPGAVDNRNFPLLQAIVIVAAILVVVANAIADMILAALDPRVRLTS